MTYNHEAKPCLWDKKYIIDNLPVWIYSDNEQPKTVGECKARISATEYTIKDIELQIEIRELELKTGSSRHQSSHEYEKWHTQALRAKQTHMYILNAYTYWLLLNERDEGEENLANKVDTLIHLLIDEPDDFVAQLETLV